METQERESAKQKTVSMFLFYLMILKSKRGAVSKGLVSGV